MLQLPILLIGLCVVAIVWLVSWRTRLLSYWAVRNVPHQKPHGLFGSLYQLKDKNVAIWFRELYQTFAGAPYVGVWLFWRPALVVQCPQLARRVLIKDADVFRNRFLSSGKSDPIGGLNIFAVNDPTWSFVRRRLTSLFTSAKLKMLQDLFVTKGKELALRFKKECTQNKVVDIRDVYTDYTTDLIGTSAFGVQCNATLTDTENDPMRKITRQFQTVTVRRGINFAGIFFFPEIIDVFRLSFFPKSATNFFRQIWERMVAQRGGYERPVEGTRDLMDALIKMKQDAAKDNEFMSEDLLIAQAAIFVQGGFETSSGTLTYATYELAYHPEIQEKLYQEIFEIKQRLGDKDFDTDSLANATYLNCVFKETLRKYPPMGWLDRVTSREYQVDDQLTLPAGMPVYVNAVAMQMDPDFFPEPYQFIPERFLPENEQDIKPFTYLPFGDGPRNCIGMRFGNLTVRYALANVILSFELKPHPNSKKPNDTHIETNSPFIVPGEMLSVQLIPRK